MDNFTYTSLVIITVFIMVILITIVKSNKNFGRETRKGLIVAFIFVISVLNEKGICVRGAIAKRNVVIRWAAVYALIMFIIIFGAYGKGYVPVDPIYANF